MGVRVTLDPTQGLVEKKVDDADVAFVVPRSMSPEGVSPHKLPTNTITTATTLSAGDAGLHTVSGSAAITTVLPLASTAAGSMFVFRSLSAHAHVITGSQEVNGTVALTDGTSQGSSLALSAVVNSSVALLCDGANWIVMANSGSLTVSGV